MVLPSVCMMHLLILAVELAPVSLDTTLSDGTGKEWPS